MREKLAGDYETESRASFWMDGIFCVWVSGRWFHTWIRRENASSGLKGLQPGGPGEYRFREAFYHR